jgi:hypothetical protein
MNHAPDDSPGLIDHGHAIALGDNGMREIGRHAVKGPP